MASYDILWKNSAEQELRTIDKKYILKILDAAELLAENPFPRLSKKLHGVETSYRIRVGDYRIIYQVNVERKEVVIMHVRHRKEAYRK